MKKKTKSVNVSRICYKKKFQIKTIFDYQIISLTDWKSILSKELNPEKASFYSDTLYKNIQEYCPIIKEFT